MTLTYLGDLARFSTSTWLLEAFNNFPRVHPGWDDDGHLTPDLMWQLGMDLTDPSGPYERCGLIL